MSKIAILTDSSCDIPQELAEKYGIDIMGFHILLDDEEGQLLLAALDQMRDSDEVSAEKCAALHRKISARLESLDRPDRDARG